MKRIILFVLLLFFVTNIYSQQDSISEYLNDGGLSNYKNIIKTDITQILQGNIQLIWEHDISGMFRIESGIGLLTSTFHKPILNALYRDGQELFYDEGLEETKMNPGLSLYVSPRLSIIKFPSFYSSCNLNLNYYFNQLLVGEVSFTFGNEINLSRKIILDINAGIGVDTHWSFDSYYYSHKFMIFNGRDLDHPNTISFFIPLNIKLGYRLN